MNNVNLQQTGGFPLETDTLDYMQRAYKSLQNLAYLGGDNYVLSGCVPTGANTGDGFLVVAGEVLEFRGGLTQSKIVIKEEKETRPFENGQVKDVFITRYASFGVGVDAIEWASIVRLKSLSVFKDLPTSVSSAIDLDSENSLSTSKAVKSVYEALKNQVPPGMIGIWSGSVNSIPAGWALCDGTAGRPNLTNCFVLGAGDQYAVGVVGGEAQHKLTISEMPEHGHNVPGGLAGQSYSADRGSSRNSIDQGNPATTKAGGDMPHNNMPPYYALAYIIKL